jgi:hypothetical protein
MAVYPTADLKPEDKYTNWNFFKINFCFHEAGYGHHEYACYLDGDGKLVVPANGRPAFQDHMAGLDGPDLMPNSPLNVDNKSCAESGLGYLIEQKGPNLVVGGLLFLVNADSRGIVPTSIRIKFPKTYIPQNAADAVRLITKMTGLLEKVIVDPTDRYRRVARQPSFQDLMQILIESKSEIDRVVQTIQQCPEGSRFRTLVSTQSDYRNINVLSFTGQETVEERGLALEQVAQKRLHDFINGSIPTNYDATLSPAQFQSLTRYETRNQNILPAMAAMASAVTSPIIKEDFMQAQKDAFARVDQIAAGARPGIDKLISLAGDKGPDGAAARETLTKLAAEIKGALETPAANKG